MGQPVISAVIFDFDGTILDTETPVYESWRLTFEHAGAEPVSLDTWLQHIGKSDDNALDLDAMLSRHLGVPALPAELNEFRRAKRDTILLAEPIRAGVEQWIAAAEARGLALAVASSSSSAWVQPHLDRIGLASHFEVVSCAGGGVPGKPDPAVYLRACSALDIDPARALAIEDSHHGVSAARSAGMTCLGIPGPITRSSDFSHASAHGESLADFDPADWL